MTKLAPLQVTLDAVHPKRTSTASSNQTQTTPFGVTLMTKVLSLTAAVILFVPVAAVFLMQAARMIA